ncbi:MAG: CDP-alcohol phosphatidyltransferase family protein, partial [Candidatus Dormibacteria bacterium]
MFTTRFQDWVRAAARRVVRGLGLARVSPNTLTVMGLVINAVSGVLIATGQLIAGGIVLLVASVFDVLD